MMYLYIPLDGDAPAQSETPPDCLDVQYEALINDELQIFRITADGRYQQLTPIQVGDTDSWSDVETT